MKVPGRRIVPIKRTLNNRARGCTACRRPETHMVIDAATGNVVAGCFWHCQAWAHGRTIKAVPRRVANRAVPSKTNPRRST